MNEFYCISFSVFSPVFATITCNRFGVCWPKIDKGYRSDIYATTSYGCFCFSSFVHLVVFNDVDNFRMTIFLCAACVWFSLVLHSPVFISILQPSILLFDWFVNSQPNLTTVYIYHMECIYWFLCYENILKTVYINQLECSAKDYQPVIIENFCCHWLHIFEVSLEMFRLQMIGSIPAQ